MGYLHIQVLEQLIYNWELVVQQKSQIGEETKERAGGHVTEDLIAGKLVHVHAQAQVTD